MVIASRLDKVLLAVAVLAVAALAVVALAVVVLAVVVPLGIMVSSKLSSVQ